VIRNSILPLLYGYFLERRKELCNRVRFFSITTDAWTDGTLRKFVVITYHWVDEDFNMHAMVGDLIYVPKQHTWFNVCQELSSRIQNAVPHDAVLVATVTDNGSNFVKMTKALHTNLSIAAIDDIGPDDWNEPLEVLTLLLLPLDSMVSLRCLSFLISKIGICLLQDNEQDTLFAWKCIDHRLQLCILDAFGEKSSLDIVKNIIQNVRCMCTFIRVSANRRQHLIAIQKQMGVKQLVPKLDCPTRWASLFMMLERFTQIYPAIQVMVLRKIFDDDFEGMLP
jgi:hypothetical protein